MFDYIKLSRVPQWIKNLFVFVPLLFSRHIFDSAYVLTVFSGFLLFCLVSSLVYVINDIIDAEADRSHAVKKNRPIASGRISKRNAVIYAVVLFIIILMFLPPLNNGFRACLVGYLILNLLYSFKLKHIVLLDIFSIAAGFMLRIIAGAYIIHVETSSWLILTTMFLSLFLGIMKRRSELYLVHDEENTSTRKVLAYYSVNFTEQMATVAAAAVIISYALYTVSDRTIYVFGTEDMIYTTPFVVYGIFRYMYLVYMNKKGENTTEIMVTDLPMIINIFLYITATVIIIYKIIP